MVIRIGYREIKLAKLPTNDALRRRFFDRHQFRREAAYSIINYIIDIFYISVTSRRAYDDNSCV